jgi:DMSO/TMAO reductase YedYZ heme-binding membrane subunit
VSARRGRSSMSRHNLTVARATPPQRGYLIWIGVGLLALVGVIASSGTAQGRDILAATQHFMLFYSGVLALVALTTAVGVGIVATDRIVMVPANRVVAQALHRAVSLAALAFLVIHIVLEILAQRVNVIDAFVPFLAAGRTFYIGLGTVASDLVVVLIVTGIARGRFATKRPWTWRAIHAVAYVCWPLSIWHGLLAGRAAKPYVDWSYGACLALAGLALIIRLVATLRSNEEKAAHPVPDRASSPIHAALPAMTQEGVHDMRTAVPGGWQQQAPQLPAGWHPAGPGGWQPPGPGGRPQAPRALPAGSGGGQAPAEGYSRSPYSHPYGNSVPYIEAHPSEQHQDESAAYWEELPPEHSPYSPYGTEEG